MKLGAALAGRHRIFLDSAPVIYLLEHNLAYQPQVRAFFERVASNEIIPVTSPVTLAECLIIPVRTGRHNLSQLFVDIIVSGHNTEFVTIGSAIGARAAEIRARYNLSLPDALQAAVALESACDAFLTNDVQFRKVKELEVLLLSELEP